MLLYSNESLVNGNDETEKVVYNINDQVYTCSSWLSRVIFEFCNNTYKIVKRDTSLMIGNCCVTVFTALYKSGAIRQSFVGFLMTFPVCVQ